MTDLAERTRAVAEAGIADGLVLGWRVGDEEHVLAAGQQGPGDRSPAASGWHEAIERPLGEDRFLVDGLIPPRRHVEFARGADGTITHVRVGLVAARRQP